MRGQDSPAVRWLRNVQVDDDIVLGDLILLELLQGCTSDSHARQLQRDLQNFGTVPMLNEKVAVQAAANYRRLRTRGITVRKTIDLIVATFCINNDHELLHQDRDFIHFEKHLGLMVFRPA